jgi:PAS domain S-box-containing protein
MYATSPEDTALRPLPRPPVRRAIDARRGVRRLITRWFFGTAAALAVLTALMLAWQTLPLPIGTERRIAPAAAFAAIAVLSLLAMRARGAWIERAMLGVLSLATIALAGTAVVLGWGLAAPGLAFYGVFVCVLCAAASRRMGLLLAAITVLALFAVAIATPGQPLPSVAPGAGVQLLTQLLVIGVGLVGGVLISFVVSRYVRSADDREQRFRGLLAIAADAYWEIDAEYRLVAATNQRDETASLNVADGLGRIPWEMQQFSADPETLDALIADLDTRVAFHEKLVHWQQPGHAPRALVVSGEPRFDERGIFKGYWGVARDVTNELIARDALAATDARYQELFARIPTPLVLHREGRVIDANPAGLQLFGYGELAEFIGRDLLAGYESGDSRERERRRIEDLALQDPGAAVGVADFKLQPRHGRRLRTRATSVRVEADGVPATLSIYVDDTDRRAAEEAVRRSETMLSHLVATSPDVITLTDLATGRYSMVNRMFERVTGWTAAEVVGRTSVELGIWHRSADRQRFVDQMRETGLVTDMPTQFATKDGRVVAMLVSGARFAFERREYLVINARDVSAVERSRLEREAILENASIGIAVTREQRFVVVNPRFEQMYGWPRGALVGQPGRVVWPSDEAYAEVGRAVGERLERGEQVDVERTARRRDGSTFLVRMLAKAIDPHHPAKGGTVWIVEDVTERRQFEQALAAARDAAEAASRAKSAFLANTSHELRTPLNGLLHLAEWAREPGLDDGRRRQYLDQVVDSARALADIISDILDLSKIEAGKLELESTVFDLGELLATLQRAYATLASARDITLTVELGPGIAGAAAGDPLRVRQVIGNFLSNAVKFTATGSVRLVAHRHGEQVRFEVHDSGPGIDEATLARLFRPFTQADESTTRRFGGTGLGLSICRELAHLMGGEVGVSSEPGRGSLFWAELVLPARAELPPNAAAQAQARDLRGLRVLLVEDNPVNMMIGSTILERWGVGVEQANDGQQAIEAVDRAAANDRPFDAVLMDVNMPTMSGYEATRLLRRRAAGIGLPIIALTAAALVSERQSAIDAGMNDFLTKPIDAQKLREALSRWVRVRS